VKLVEGDHGEKDRFVYEYDFGGGWSHQILVEKIVPKEEGKHYPACVAGKRACPAEDCGGVGGHENLLRTIGDAEHPDHDDMIEWIGDGFDPEAFNIDWINGQLRGVK